MYNIYNNRTAKMESYMDDKNDNKWKTVNLLINSADYIPIARVRFLVPIAID
jgi:hypothetical protein